MALGRAREEALGLDPLIQVGKGLVPNGAPWGLGVCVGLSRQPLFAGPSLPSSGAPLRRSNCSGVLLVKSDPSPLLPTPLPSVVLGEV